MKISNLLFVLIVMVYCHCSLLAQADALPMLFGSSMYAAERSNPALAAEGGAFFAVPFLGNAALGAETALRWNDIFTRRADDSLEFNKTTFLEALDERASVAASAQVHILAMRLQYSSLSLSFGISDRVLAQGTLPEEAARLILQGNAPLENRTLQFSAEGRERPLRLLHFREWYAGLAFSLSENIHIGGRVKLLNGFAAIDARQLDVDFRTDSLTYALQLQGSYDIRTYQPDEVQALPLSFGNIGYGVDVGIQININDDISLQGSLLDIGGITWSDERSKIYSGTDKLFTFQGLVVEDWERDLKTDSLETILRDSLEATFGEYRREGFTTALPTRLLVAAEYLLGESTAAGLVLQSDAEFFQPLSTVTLRHTFFNVLTLIGGVQFSRHSTGISGGVLINTPILQVHALAEQIGGVFAPSSAAAGSVRFGIAIPMGSSSGDETTTADRSTKNYQSLPSLRPYNRTSAVQ